jgi:hypothetical protein
VRVEFPRLGALANLLLAPDDDNQGRTAERS